MFLLRYTGRKYGLCCHNHNRKRLQFMQQSNLPKLRKYPTTFRRPTDPHEVARSFFDNLYSKKFATQWPSIRCAMMSRKKYAAIMNNHTHCDDTEEEFLESGATDIVATLHDNARQICNRIEEEIKEVELTIAMVLGKSMSPAKNDAQPDLTLENVEHPANVEGVGIGDIDGSLPGGVVKQNDNAAPGTDDLGGTVENTSHRYNQQDLILDGHYDRLEWLRNQHKTYKKFSTVCQGLRVYAYDKCDLTEFDDPMDRQKDIPILDYFLLDGASILPVLALDPKPHEHILDTCAAPGGKLMCMMQILAKGSGSIIANDVALSRVGRVRKVQDEYIPKNASIRERMKLMSVDASTWHETETATYDKVLVDVPCTTDRHSMLPTLDIRDHIFSHLRKRERANLPQTQSEILRSAVMACRPGGTVVYSTCTLSTQQNEYVIQMTVQYLLQKYGISCEIEDLTPMSALLEKHYNFFEKSELGVLALPFLEANFGPIYVCKIIRVR